MTDIKPVDFTVEFQDWLGQKIGVGDEIVYPARHPDGTKTMVLAEVLRMSKDSRFGGRLQMIVQPLGESRPRKFRERAMWAVPLVAFETITKLPQRNAA